MVSSEKARASRETLHEAASPRSAPTDGGSSGWARVRVAVALPVSGEYTYSVSSNLQPVMGVGLRVLVPFGRRRATGYVLGPDTAEPTMSLKQVIRVLDDGPLFPPSMAPFFQWVADYYLHPIGEVIRTALPGGINAGDVTEYRLRESREAPEPFQMPPVEAAAIVSALADGPKTGRALARAIGGKLPQKVIADLIADGQLERHQRLRAGTTRIRKQRIVSAIADAPIPNRQSEARRAIHALLLTEGPMSASAVTDRIPQARHLIGAMTNAGQVTVSEVECLRDPFGEAITPDTPPTPTPDQARAIAAIQKAIGTGFSPFLLAGVTGSGKTEVYLQAVAAAVAAGRSALVLVPEIALISQTERRFRARFGEQVSVLHSGLSAGERFDQWRRLLRGDTTIAIGARSALFAPIDNIGVVIVDEEHDGSYKQESGLRYNARDLAVVRARSHDCPVLLGSATPSVESYTHAQSGKYELLTLPHRVAQRPMPEIQVVDLRDHRHRRGADRLLTPTLTDAIRATLSRGDQAVLFLNRRGFAGYPVCADCGAAIRCRHCDISLTFHQGIERYRCHYCGFDLPARETCTECDGRIIHLGLGTEKLESIIAERFPDARIGRMDRDTTAAKGALIGLLKQLRQREIDILVGTQMVAKGHDFPNITLVGVICADLGLSFPDFRAGERTFQLLSQVAGRAGRGDRPGTVVLQTYAPDQVCIDAARRQDYPGFYNHEIAFRDALGYPPKTRLVLIRVSAEKRAHAKKAATDLGAVIRKAMTPDHRSAIEVLGPIESAIPRVAGRYRWQLLIKTKKTDKTVSVHRFLTTLARNDPRCFSPTDSRVAIDIDPYSFM